MGWSPYAGDDYIDFEAVEAWCRSTAAAFPDRVGLSEVGQSREGRPMLLLTVGRIDGGEDRRPGFWLDGGTHAGEWTGVVSTLFTLSRWLTDDAMGAWFDTHTAYVMPCISPDGYQAMHEGAPFLRSTLRPPKPGTTRVGLEPRDLDGDGVVRWMRWRHPAGPFVPDAEVPMLMRPRRLEDDPGEAFFFCAEGELLNWDGARWTVAPLRFGIDLNRNFPSRWAPFEMFGMDSGDFPLSEPESRAVVAAFAARPCIGAAVTNHTYTGCVLTQPYREDTPLGSGDLLLMERLAEEAVEGTGYKVYKVHPDFTYDAKQSVVGVWSDTLSTVFGVPGYTLELWDPFGHAGVELKKPAEMFKKPDPDMLRKVLEAFSADAGNVEPWRPFDHPQLGPVEIGGIDYLRTVRNPPVSLLKAECERGYAVADRLRRCLPRVEARTRVEAGEVSRIDLVLENLGCLSTAGLAHGEKLASTPPVSATLILEGDAELVAGTQEQAIGHLDGWGAMQVAGAGHPLYPSLPGRGHRGVARWWIKGSGRATLRWRGGRGGEGEATVELSN